MKVFIGFECSGRVRDQFLMRGHDAISCDMKLSEVGGPHIVGDVFDVLLSVSRRRRPLYDLAILHPECTYLAGCAEWAYSDPPYHQNVKDGTLVGEDRRAARESAKLGVLRLWNCGLQRICIENPVGVLSKLLGRPQIVQPYQFGDDASKATCLWRRGLPKLVADPAQRFPPRLVIHNGKTVERWSNQTDSGQNRLTPSENRQADRSRTYVGIARAMATQWG